MKYYPMELKAVSKDILWGGTKLKRLYSKDAPFANIAESWELTVRNDGMSEIINGEYKGETLYDFIKRYPEAVGTESKSIFPLLIKYIDAAQDLSVQVHPDNAYASENENASGKTEMWYILDADEDAEIIYGFSKDISDTDLKNAIENSEFSDILRRIKVNKGDVYFIPAGQVHALCHGTLIAEIQQNSNITYRIFDYDRTGPNGNKRELHISKALDTIKCYSDDDIMKLRFSGRNNRRSQFKGTDVIADCEFFRVSTLNNSADAETTFTVDEKSFAHLLFTYAENATLMVGSTVVTVKSGSSYYIPAGAGLVSIYGKCHILISEI